MNRTLLLASLASALLFSVGCSDTDETGDPPGSTDQTPTDETPGNGDPVPNDAPTWHKDVLPIVQANCQGCHATGGIAPFALTSYAEAAEMHEAIAVATSEKRMPPWMASDACQPLKNPRKLSFLEIDVIQRWSKAGAPEGNPADAPPAPGGAETLPWVDDELSMEAAYTPNSALTDDYRCFILDPKLQTETDVIGFEVVPGARTQVHHVILYAVSPQEAQAADDAEAGQGWTCFGGPGIENFAMVGGWVPGTTVIQYPPNTGIRLAKDRKLVMQVHYNLSKGAQPDTTRVRMQYAKSLVSRPARLFPIADRDFVIPGTSSHSTTAAFKMPSSFSAVLWGVTPHMHTKGRRITVKQDNHCLVDIPKWDFHWQQSYLFDAPNGLPLDGGDTLSITCEWDNPTDKQVTWGEGTEDEMCIAFLYATQ